MERSGVILCGAELNFTFYSNGFCLNLVPKFRRLQTLAKVRG